MTCIDKAREYMQRLKDEGKCTKTEFAGAVRRKEQPKKDIDIVCGTPSLPLETEKIDRFQINGCNIDLYKVNPEHFSACLLAKTGPKGSAIGMRREAQKKGMFLNQFGLYKDGQLIATDEDEICQKVLDRPCKPPELRGK